MNKRRADRIAEPSAETILMGRVPSGERLDKNRLAEELGVQHTPIRKAFQKLAGTDAASATALTTADPEAAAAALLAPASAGRKVLPSDGQPEN